MKDHKGNENNTVIFTNSIEKFDRNSKIKINNNARSKRVRFRNFPGATSEKLLHCMDPTLTEGNYDTTIVPLDINDIISNDTSTKVENLILNLEEIAIKLKKRWN